MTTADAVDREAAWLQSSGDGLPALLASAGGPWQVIQAYRPRTPDRRQTGIYLRRAELSDERFANQRLLDSHAFVGDLVWPVGATGATGSWEAEQRALDAAVELLRQRVRGLVMDHSHGGRFLSVAEAPSPSRILVRFEDPAQTEHLSPAMLLAQITYSADDRDFVG